MFHDLLQDLRHGARSLRRSPGFAVMVVLTLGVGIGANAAIFSLLDAVLLRAVPVGDPQSLVIFAQGRGRSDQPMEGRVDMVPYELYKRLREGNPAFAGVAAQDSIFTSAVVRGSGPRDEAEGNHALRLWVSGNYFEVLGLRAVVGRALQPADDVAGAAPVIVLSHLFWQRRFGGDPSLIGGRLAVNGRPHTVVGVMPPGFLGLDMSRRIDFWVPIATMRSDFSSDRAILLDKAGDPLAGALGRVAPGVSAAAAEASVNVTLQQYLAEDPRYAQRAGVRQATRFVLDPGGQGLSMFRESFRQPCWC
jgi:hypothetical protein